MQNESHGVAAGMGNHWWYRGRASAVASLVARAGLPRGSCGRVLDYGCGTGHMGATLSLFGDVYGVDSSAEALAVGHFESYTAVAQAEIDELPGPFADSFRLLACLDVLEHVEDDAGLLGKLSSLLDRDGLVVTSVPMWPELYCSIDEEAGHVRRYSKATLGDLFARARMRPVASSGYVVVLLPFARAHRRRVISGRSSSVEEYRTPPALANSLLAAIARTEGRLARYVALPTGLSRLTVLRRA